jgi:cell division protein ZapA
MNNNPTPERTTVTIRLLDRSYQVSCSAEERPLLLASAELVSGKMQQIRQTGKVVGMERMLAVVALNLAQELLVQQQASEQTSALDQRINQLSEKIRQTLDDSRV